VKQEFGTPTPIAFNNNNFGGSLAAVIKDRVFFLFLV